MKSNIESSASIALSVLLTFDTLPISICCAMRELQATGLEFSGLVQPTNSFLKMGLEK
jgi:hypothetical protein